MSAITNIAAYKFISIDDPEALRTTIRDRAEAAGLKGTVLLAPEGINLFLAGADESVRGMLAWLREDARFADLEAKFSVSADVPFRKLLVKVKREIIRMDNPAIRPEAGRAPSVQPATLARWLEQGHDDAGRPVVMLDTRNDFEVDAGTFDGAIDWRLQRFTQFPQALLDNRAQLEGKTVVSFCTGGIRCEKAALFMAQAGVEHVYQLEGGILKYFEETGGPGYTGECFVFDARERLDANLTAGGPAPAGAAKP